MNDPRCLACGGPSPSWAVACSDKCADRVRARWGRLMPGEDARLERQQRAFTTWMNSSDDTPWTTR